MTDTKAPRRWGWAVAAAAAVLWLAGCGNTSSETPRAEAPVPTPAAAPQVARAVDRTGQPVIVTFGDSLTAGFGVDPGKSYPDVLQRMLDENGYHYRIVNEGVSGDTTTNGLARLDAVLADKPEIVILELGGNDGLRGVAPGVIKTNLAKIITTLQKANVRVLLAGMTLPPNYGPDYVKAFTENYADLAKQYRLDFLPFFYAGVLETEGFLQQDGIHATIKGNQRVAKNVYESLVPLLKK